MTARLLAWPGAEGHLVDDEAARPVFAIADDARDADLAATVACVISGVHATLEHLVRAEGTEAGIAEALMQQLGVAQLVVAQLVKRLEPRAR